MFFNFIVNPLSKIERIVNTAARLMDEPSVRCDHRELLSLETHLDEQLHSLDACAEQCEYGSALREQIVACRAQLGAVDECLGKLRGELHIRAVNVNGRYLDYIAKLLKRTQTTLARGCETSFARDYLLRDNLEVSLAKLENAINCMFVVLKMDQ